MIYPRRDFEKASCKDADIEKGLLVDLFETIERERWNFHSLFLVKNGAKVFEAYASGRGPGRPEECYSMTKTFVAAAIGLCRDQGLLNLETPLIRYFGDKLHSFPLPGYEKVTVRDLLTMTVGHDEERIDPVLLGADPYDTFFSIPLTHEPGTHFFYNNLATHMLSLLVQNLSGMNTNDFLDRHLYPKIEMAKPRWREAFGSSIGPYGLQLDAPDLARFGHLLLNEGFWRGEQLLSRDFVREMGKIQATTSTNGNPADRFGYGFQTWINDFGGFRLAGLYKQYVVIHPETGIVFVTQAYESREILDLFSRFVLPAIRKGWQGDTFTLRHYLQRFTDHSGLALNEEKRHRAENPDGIIEFPLGQ